jgi:hypothetical protein
VTHHRIAAEVSLQPVPLFQNRTDGGDAAILALEADIIIGVGTHLDTYTVGQRDR